MIDPTDPAFPGYKLLDILDTEGKHHYEHFKMSGLTKREYFSVEILKSVIIWDAIMNRHERSDAGKKENLLPVATALADAFILQLNKEPK